MRTQRTIRYTPSDVEGDSTMSNYLWLQRNALPSDRVTAARLMAQRPTGYRMALEDLVFVTMARTS